MPGGVLIRRRHRLGLVVGAVSAAQVQGLDLVPFLPEPVDQGQDLLYRFHVGIDGLAARAEMDVDRVEPDEPALAVLLEDRHRPFDVHTELGVLLARGQIGVRLVVDVRVHAQGGVDFGTGPLRVPLREPAEVLQLLFRLDVEAPDARLQCA